jgi:hypothetical protein
MGDDANKLIALVFDDPYKADVERQLEASRQQRHSAP